MANRSETKTKRVISGMRPTGRLHIGHYFGALQNWVRLQSDPSYECFYFIADWHALTSDYADSSCIAENTIQIATDYLAAGLDPKNDKCVIFLQSLVPEHAELHLLLSMVTPLGWLERVPTYKEALENVKDKDLHTYGFLGYPVLQTADIVIYSSSAEAGQERVPLVVPVGEDQVSHVELSREIVRKFNFHNGFFLDAVGLSRPENIKITNAIHLVLEGKQGAGELPTSYSVEQVNAMESRIRRKVSEGGLVNFIEKFKRFSEVVSQNEAIAQFVGIREVVTEPQYELTATPRVPGLDGRKMSKSYGNAIMLSESNETIWEKVRRMKTDPARQRRENPGNPDICPVYDWHKLFSPPETLKWSAEGCRTAGIGCIECKRAMADHLIEWIAPIRKRRRYYEHREKLVRRFLREGSVQARVIAQQTMVQVRDAVFGKNRIRRRNLRLVQRP